MKKHTKKFYDKAYREYTAKIRGRGGVPISRANFEANWDIEASRGTKNIKKSIEYSTLYGTKYSAALAEHRILKSKGYKVSLESLKQMTTQDFATIYRKEIDDYYAEQRRLGMSKDDARKSISQTFFGSP